MVKGGMSPIGWILFGGFYDNLREIKLDKLYSLLYRQCPGGLTLFVTNFGLYTVEKPYPHTIQHGHDRYSSIPPVYFPHRPHCHMYPTPAGQGIPMNAKTVVIPLPTSGSAPRSNTSVSSKRPDAPPSLEMETLSPLQRQRLETAVKMLVNYLVSASTGKQDML